MFFLLSSFIQSVIFIILIQILFLPLTHAEIKSVKPLEFKKPGIRQSPRRPSSKDKLRTSNSYQLKLNNFQIEGFGELPYKKTQLKQSN